MKIKTLTILIFLFGAQHVYSQKGQIVDSIELVKNLIRTTKSVESLYIGGHPKASKQCLRFLFLLKRSNLEDLIALSNDSNSCLRTYAYASLLYKKYKKTNETKLSLQKDSSQLFYMHGCAGGTLKMSYILDQLKQWYKKKEIEHWVELYSENESLWIKYLFQT